jgi:ABC-type branched-subunit amino acid transport system substrate-binding protein
MSSTIKLAWVLVAALAAGGALAQSGVTANSVTVGQSVPLTGANKGLGEEIRNGALAYFRKANDAGGVHGRKIEMVSLDDGNEVKRAGENTQKLVEEQHVFALFGYASATLSRPALPFVDQHGVPFIHPFTGADPMRVFNKHIYNVRGSYADELEKIVEHFVPLGVTRFGIVYYDDVVGKENFSAVERALKKRNYAPVATAAIQDRAKPDIETAVQDIAKGSPDVVILTTLFKASADFIRLARKSGLYAQMASNSFPGASPLAKELGAEGSGVIVATVVPPYTQAALPIVAEYRGAMDKQFGNKEYSFTSLESYIGAKIMVEGMRRAGPKLTRESFMRALDGMSNYDMGGYAVKFSPTNHNGSSFVELAVITKNQQFQH